MPKQKTSKPSFASLPPHLEQIAKALRARADAKNPKLALSYQASIVVRREVTKLAKLAGVRRLVSHSATFTRAMIELNGRELATASRRRAVASGVNILARWLDLVHLMPQPEPVPKKELPPLKRHKAIRRFRLNGNWLEEYGVEMGDRLLVVMTGDVRSGEVGYFRITETYGERRYYYNAFHFIHEVDETCIEWARPNGSICLRNYGGKCMGKHDGGHNARQVYAYGRVCGVERNRVPLETTLTLRPYDEREGGPTTSLSAEPEDVPQTVNPPSEAETTRKVDDLRRRLDSIGDDITDCSERMRLEKEIFDIEHPKDADWNDWSAWEEGGEQ